MYKVAVIGDKDSILAFKALGVEVYTAIDGSDAEKNIKELAKENFGVIFITEDLAKEIPSTIDKYRQEILPQDLEVFQVVFGYHHTFFQACLVQVLLIGDVL